MTQPSDRYHFNVRTGMFFDQNVPCSREHIARSANNLWAIVNQQAVIIARLRRCDAAIEEINQSFRLPPAISEMRAELDLAENKVRQLQQLLVDLHQPNH